MEVLKTNLISEKEYEKIMDPIKMTKPKQVQLNYYLLNVLIIIFSIISTSV